MIHLQRTKSLPNYQRGIGRFTLLVFGLLGAATIFVAYNVLPFFYYYFELTNQIQSLVAAAGNNSDTEIRNKLMYHIKYMGIPAEPGDIKILRQDAYITISITYKEYFYVTWKGKDYDIHTFNLTATGEGPL